MVRQLTVLCYLLAGGITCLFSLGCALILAYLDKRAEKLLCKEQGKTGECCGQTCLGLDSFILEQIVPLAQCFIYGACEEPSSSHQFGPVLCFVEVGLLSFSGCAETCRSFPPVWCFEFSVWENLAQLKIHLVLKFCLSI